MKIFVVVHRCLSCAWSVFGSVILNQWCVCGVCVCVCVCECVCVCMVRRAGNYKHIGVAFNFVSFKLLYEGHLESKERFAIKKYLLVIGKKKNMQVLSHTFAYFST